MKNFCIFCLVALIASAITFGIAYYFVEEYKVAESEEQALHYYKTLEPVLISEFVRKDWAEWIYRTSPIQNIKTQSALIEARNRFSKYIKRIQNGIGIFKWRKFRNLSLVQTFRILSKIFVPFVNTWDETLLELQKTMLEADIIRTQVDENSTLESVKFQRKISMLTLFVENNTEVVKQKWTNIHNTLGTKFSSQFTEFVRVFNNIGEMRGFLDAIDMFLTEEYEIQSGSVQNMIKFVWTNLKPFYEQLHAYYRWTLLNKYGHDEILVSKRGTIPLHVIVYDEEGHWAPTTLQSDTHLRFTELDILSRLNWTSLKLYEHIDQHFTFMNFTPFSKTFWKNWKFGNGATSRESLATSVNTGRRSANLMVENQFHKIFSKASCEPIRYIAGNLSEFRLKGCEEISFKGLQVAYQSVGLMKHFVLARNQTFYPLATRGMELIVEPIGNIWSMIANSPKFLKKLGLPNENILSNFEIRSTELQREHLYLEALRVMPTLASLMSQELWRWSIFRNTSLHEQPALYNCHYWKVRDEICGVKPPITRKSTDFDASSQPNLFQPFGTTREFIITVLQYQIFRSLCITAGEYWSPNGNGTTSSLHQCDFTNSQVALEKLKFYMELGSSKPWMTALAQLTGERDNVSPAGILEYFQPLHDWLKEFNLKNSIPVGWIGAVEEYVGCTNSQM